MARDVRQVADDHLAAVLEGDPSAMAADYAGDAVLERPGEIHRGRPAIEAYFRTVPDRLAGARVVFDALDVEGSRATFRWHLEGAGAEVSGTDTCTIRNGKIVYQTVELHTADF